MIDKKTTTTTKEAIDNITDNQETAVQTELVKTKPRTRSVKVTKPEVQPIEIPKEQTENIEDV